MTKKNGEMEYWLAPLYDEDGVQASSGIGTDGREYPDPMPMAPPIGYQAPPDLMTMIRSMVRSEELRRKLDAEGFDTFEEAEDFEFEDDPLDKLTPYEEVFFPPDEKSAPGPNRMAGPQAGQEAAPSEVKQGRTPNDASEGAVSSPPPVSEAPKA